MYECPNCGGNLRYDIPSKMMACASCDSKFDPYEVSDKNGAQEQDSDVRSVAEKFTVRTILQQVFVPSVVRQRCWRAACRRNTDQSISFRLVRRRSSARKPI